MLAVWVARVPVRVPVVVTGEPDTLKIDGKERATLVVPELVSEPAEKLNPLPTVTLDQVLEAER